MWIQLREGGFRLSDFRDDGILRLQSRWYDDWLRGCYCGWKMDMLGGCQLLSKLQCCCDCSIARFPRSASEVCELPLQGFVLLVEIFTHAKNTFPLLIAGLCDRFLIPKHALLIADACPEAFDNSHVVVNRGFPSNGVLTETIGHLLYSASRRRLSNSIVFQHFDGIMSWWNI